MTSAVRQYDLIVLGATGYTGRLTTEYIALHLPTDLKWAIAGRSESKLSSVADHLQSLNSDRTQPSIELANLTPIDLDPLVKKCKILINTVGPYHLYSCPVVEACAKNGTHYLDVTGESPWTMEMTRKYHSLAASNKAIMISQIGIESSPSDLVTYALATLIRKTCNCATAEVIGTIHQWKGSPSGGSLATALTIRDSYSQKEIAGASNGNWSSSPVPHPKTQPSSWWRTTKELLGVGCVRTVPELGVLTTSVMSGANVAIVQRTWGLLDDGKYYGRNFDYREYMSVRNRFLGLLTHFAIMFAILLFEIRPLRRLIQKLMTAAGSGPDREQSSKDVFEFRAVAAADHEERQPRKAFGRLRYEGPLYYFTGIFLAEAAMVILKEEISVERLRGGYLTPAMLGQPYIDRLMNAGIVFEADMLPINPVNSNLT